MPTLHAHLLQDREPLPHWLAEYRCGQAFSRRDFFSSRVVFYPGSGFDGHAVKAFASAHAAHSFLYADYLEPAAEIKAALLGRRNGYKAPFTGYEALDLHDLIVEDLAPNGATSHVLPRDPVSTYQGKVAPFGFLAVLVRREGFDDGHGPERLAILFLGADAVATYDVLFCQTNGYRSPYAVLIQDHGFGSNYTRFARGGLLESLARRTRVWPELLLVAEADQPWSGYEPILEVEGDVGGMHQNLRRLHQRNKSILR